MMIIFILMVIILILVLTKLTKFASQVDNFGCWLPISTYVDEQVHLEKKLLIYKMWMSIVDYVDYVDEQVYREKKLHTHKENTRPYKTTHP